MAADPFIYLQFIRKVMLPLPGVTEQLCLGTPAMYLQKKLLCRLLEDGETLAINSDEREIWMKKDPETFFITNHYLKYAYMLINLTRVEPADLEQLLIAAWLLRAPKSLVKAYNNQAK